MTAAQVLAAILAIFPFMSGNNRACIVSHRDRIEHQLAETTAAGVPIEIMAAVAFVETHMGCDRNEGGNWGAPIDRFHRHTAGTHMDAAQSLLTGHERCGDWDGAVMRFRSGMCRTQQPYAVRYVRMVNNLAQRIRDQAH